MKKNSRLIALLLALLMVTLPACSAGTGQEVTTEADSTAPKTTEAVIPETTEEPSISVVVPPETVQETTAETLPETTPGETTSPYPPHDGETVRILMQSGKGEAFTSEFAEGELATYLSAREAALLADHNTVIKMTVSADIADRVKNGVLAAENDFDFMLIDPDAGADPEHPSGGGFRDGGGTFVVFFGDHQDMPRIDGADVEKGVNQFVFIDFGGGDLPGDDLAEDAVRHDVSP